MRTTSLLLLLLGFILTTPSFCQTRIIKGIVINESNEAIVNASVMFKNSSAETLTDVNGRFQLTATATEVAIVVKHLGFKTKEIKLSNEADSVHVVMEAETLSLDEVVVTATSITFEKKSLSYSVSTRDDDKSMRGKVAGVTIDASSIQSIEDLSGADAGVLTAGEINDFGKWILWKDIEKNDLKEWKNLWKIYPDQRFVLQLETENGMPVINAKAQLIGSDGMIYWSSRTDNTGKAELWLNLFGGSEEEKNLRITVSSNDKSFTVEKPKEFHRGINVLKIPTDCNVPDAVDVAFVVDATGSMQDEIDYLKAEMSNIIGKIKDSLSDKNLNLACVFYRDLTDAYVTKQSDFNPDINEVINFIKSNNADAGGDYPEAVEHALNAAINHLSWRENATARMIFLVLDAPPHETPEVTSEIKRLISQAASKGIRIIPVACSGIDKSTEYLMRSMALATNGTYVFLTDHSGVGYHHIEPTTDKYNVELLNSILFRIMYNFSLTEPCDRSDPIAIASADTVEVLNPNYVFDTSIYKGTVDSTLLKEFADSVMEAVTRGSEFFGWKYYPNPTLGMVHVTIDGELHELFVTDLSGKILLRFEMKHEQTLDVDLSDFPAGTYFISGEYSLNKRVSGKIILIH